MTQWRIFRTSLRSAQCISWRPIIMPSNLYFDWTFILHCDFLRWCNALMSLYTCPKWKLHFYNGIYYAWDKKSNTSQCNKWNSIIFKTTHKTFISSVDGIIKKIVTGSFRVKVMNSPIYSIQREVINEFEYLVSIIAFTLIFRGDNCPSSHCLLSIYKVSF